MSFCRLKAQSIVLWVVAKTHSIKSSCVELGCSCELSIFQITEFYSCCTATRINALKDQKRLRPCSQAL